MNSSRAAGFVLSLGVLSAGLALSATSAVGAKTSNSFTKRVVASGLSRPTGIVVQGSETVYFTEIPSPGVAGAGNGVRVLSLGSGAVASLHDGEPEPVNLALGKGSNLYWTCKSAGVILERKPNGTVAPLLVGLVQPSGIAVGHEGDVYFTQLPTPGVGGGSGGTNTVNVSDGTSITVLTTGEPQPTDIAVNRRGDAYWTCKSAGVILQRSAAGVVSLLLSGLDSPTGIALDHTGGKLYFTEIPTPGVSASGGGRNAVYEIDLTSMERTLVDFGDPEPTDIAVARNGSLYWTCSSAGVIVEASRTGGR